MDRRVEQAARSVREWFGPSVSPRLQLLNSWLRIESGSRDKHGVDTFGAAVGASFAELGGRVLRHSHDEYGDAYSILFPGHGRVVMLGHLDTVWPSGTVDAWDWDPDPEWICGPGVLDMKGGIFVALQALCCLQQLALPAPGVEVLLTPDEEIGSPWGAQLIKEHVSGADACLVFEPALAGGELKSKRAGVSYYELRVDCAGGHPGHRNPDARNAVCELARLLVDINQHCAVGDGGVTVSPTRLVVDVPVNVISPTASVTLDVRFHNDHGRAAFERDTQALVQSESNALLEAKLEPVGARRPPLQPTPRNDQLLDVFRDAARLLGLQLKDATTDGASDAGYVAELSVPVVDGLGPWGRGIHARDEAVTVRALADRGALVATTLFLLAERLPMPLSTTATSSVTDGMIKL